MRPRGPGAPTIGFVTEHYDVIIVGSNGKAHELDNLYVVDTSFFPSVGAVNPALTAMTNAVRVGEHLLSRMS